MSTGPRIVFTRFDSSESPKLVPWIAHSQRVLHSPIEGDKPTSAGSVVWQLVSANNRQLARSAEVYLTFEDARNSALGVVAGADDLVVTLVSEDARGVLGWYAAIGETAVVMGARWYATQRDRRQAIELALRSVAVAEVHVGARLSDPTLMAGERVYEY